jgi:hypothetical protein
MLAPDQRAVLREHLRPDPGSELDLAVATTFTLDLTAALVAPLSFASFDIGANPDPIAILEAVRSSANRVTVFCQAGQIRVPATASDLMSVLEPMIHAVEAPIPGFVFHPKVWMLRYRTPDGPTYRLLCGSRNLTDDVSWDTILRVDGHPGTRPDATNRPLVDFVEALPRLAVRPLPASRLDEIMELAEEIRRLEWDFPSEVTGHAFHALGLRRQRSPSSLAQALTGRRSLVISPFVDDGGIATATATEETTIVSRPQDLERLQPETLDGVSCQIISPLAGLADPDDAPDDTDPQSLLGGLHAKVYAIESGARAHLFVGSANATSAGIDNGNVEFVVQITGGRKHFGVDALLDGESGLGALLETYNAAGGAELPLEETIGRALENLLRRLATLHFVATVERAESIALELTTATAPAISPDTRVTVELLTRAGTAATITDGAPISVRFTDLPLADVTPFLVLRATQHQGSLFVERSTVVRAELRNDPPDRLDEIIARQVDTPEKFIRFLLLLLGLGGLVLEPAGENDGGGTSQPWMLGHGPGVFEMVIRALGDHPQALRDLDRLVTRLEQTEQGRKNLPEGFESLWTTVRAAMAKLDEGGR